MEYCVTGGTGFIASHIIKALLANGNTVRATVRNPEDEEKVQFLWDMDGAKERLKLFKADLMEEGSFDEAVNGVDGVFHTASPVAPSDPQNIQETLIDPAIKGTTNVLTSCAKATSVNRIVVTSTIGAVIYGKQNGTLESPFNEFDWSDPDYCKQNKLWYAYAKTLAEKEAWRLAEDLKKDVVTVNPSFVIGPSLTPTPTSSLAVTLGLLTGTIPSYPNMTMGFVHIDDVVKCHIIAMEDKRASGRLLCSGPVTHCSEIGKMIKSKYSKYPITDRCGSDIDYVDKHSLDTSKLSELGFPAFTSIEQMFDDCIASFEEKGLLQSI